MYFLPHFNSISCSIGITTSASNHLIVQLSIISVISNSFLSNFSLNSFIDCISNKFIHNQLLNLFIISSFFNHCFSNSANNNFIFSGSFIRAVISHFIFSDVSLQINSFNFVSSILVFEFIVSLTISFTCSVDI